MSDPVFDLLERLVKASEDQKSQNVEVMTRLDAVRDMLRHLDVRLRTLEGEFERQDGQLTALDARISGNYKGLTVQYEDVQSSVSELSRLSSEHRQGLHALRVVVVDLAAETQRLQERWMEESGHSRRTLTEHGATIEELIKRQDRADELLSQVEAQGG